MSITGRTTVETVSEEIIRLDADFFPTPWTKKQWEELELSTHTIFGWRENGELKGFALIWTMEGDDTAHLLKILLLTQSRGTGVALTFWSSIEQELKGRGFSSVYLEVEAHNVRARSFYEKVGFKLLRRNKGYYSNGDDALTMSMTL